MSVVEKIINKFNMKPLPDEGGYYTETYRSQDIIKECCLGESYGGNRNMSTAILYLITPTNFSHLHRLKGDEVFHFYLGDPVYMLNLLQDKTAREIVMGHDLEAGQKVQHMVPKNTWQGACLQPGGDYALLGTTVTPGFDFNDYESGKEFKNILIEKYPLYKEKIRKLL